MSMNLCVCVCVCVCVCACVCVLPRRCRGLARMRWTSSRVSGRTRSSARRCERAERTSANTPTRSCCRAAETPDDETQDKLQTGSLSQTPAAGPNASSQVVICHIQVRNPPESLNDVILIIKGRCRSEPIRDSRLFTCTIISVLLSPLRESCSR